MRTWTDEQEAVVRENWHLASASEIASMLSARFHVRYSRNAVIGKAVRLGLGNKGTPSSHRKSHKRKPVNLLVKPVVQNTEDSVATKKRRHTNMRHWTSPGVSTPGFIPDIVDECAEPVPLRDATFNQCKWPASDDVRDMRVCGKFASYGVYCEKHAMLAYRQMPERRRSATMTKPQEFDHKPVGVEE